MPEQGGTPDVNAGTTAIRVAIVEDQAAIRDGLGFLIGNSPGYACVGGFGSAEAALQGLDSADVVLMDIGLPGMSGIEGIVRLKDRHPETKFVALTVYDDDERIFRALCAGASGYLLKKTPPARLLESLGEVMAGGAPMSPDIASRVLDLFRRFQPPPAADYRLTPHELRLVRLLAEGHSYKTAAAELGSSVNTIAFHMRSIYRKLEVHSKSEAVAKALREGLVR
jgi:DNA-binding NarL/FixJ family response regulator